MFLQSGSFNSVRGGAEVGGAVDRADFRLSASHHETDGISKADEANGNTEEDSYEATTVSANAGWNFPANARLRANVLWTDAESEFDGFVPGAEGNVGDGDELSKTEELIGNLTLDVPMLNGRLQNTLLAGYAEIDRDDLSNGGAQLLSDGERLTYRYQGTLQMNGANKLAVGAEREETDANGDDTSHQRAVCAV